MSKTTPSRRTTRPVQDPAHRVHLANGLDFCQGSVIKYACRYDAKNGIEDLKKAHSFIDKMIAEEERKQAGSITAGLGGTNSAICLNSKAASARPFVASSQLSGRPSKRSTSMRSTASFKYPRPL